MREEWWDWELVFSGHAELRMEQRGVSEVDVRSMLQSALGHSPSIVPGRFRIDAAHTGRPWVVIVEPDPADHLLVVVTIYQVSR